MRHTTIVALAVAALLAGRAPAPAQAPMPVSAEIRSGVSVPSGDLSDAGTESGLLLGADVFVGFFPRFSLYGGYAWHRFGCEACVDDVTASGPRGGVKLTFPLPGDARPWARGGLSWSSSDGLGGDPDGELGLEFGGGIDYAHTSRFALVPAFHYRTFTQNFQSGEMDLTYLTLELGLHVDF